MDNRTQGHDQGSEQSKCPSSQANIEQAKPSRFSRRKFLQTSAVASPLLFSVKSPSAWGACIDGQGSIAAMISGNLSNVQNCLAPVKDPAYWDQVMTATSPGAHLRVKEFLWEQRMVAPADPFYATFWGLAFTQRPVPNSNQWDYLITVADTSLTLAAALVTPSNPFTIAFVKRNGNGGTPPDPVIIDIINLHQYIVSGYLNTLFSPDYVNYIYDYPNLDIFLARVLSALDSYAEQALAAGGAPGVPNALTALMDELDTWLP